MLCDEIARRLLVNVYHPVCAVAGISETGEAECVTLFDTYFGCPPAECCADAKEIWFFTNHPEGRRDLYKEDVTHIRALMKRHAGKRLRVFITSEDDGCREYPLFSQEEI